jgi:hypothetical protein
MGGGQLGHTWVSDGPGGRPRVAKRIHLRSGGDDADRALSAARALIGARDPALVPVEEVGLEGDDLWIVSELDLGVPLRRLLSLTALTPGQAAAVIQSLFHGLDALRELGFTHGRLHAGNVHVGPEGKVRLGDGGLSCLEDGPREGDQEVDPRALAVLLRRIVQEGRRTPAWSSADARRLAWAVAALAPEGHDLELGLMTVRQAAGAVLRDGGRDRAEAELASLVAAIRPPPVPGTVLSGPRVTGPAPRRTSLKIAAGLALIAVCALAGELLWSMPYPDHRAPVVSSVRVLIPAADPPSASPTPTGGPAAVPDLAPAQAGPITGIEVRSLGKSCAAGSPCLVRVFVHLERRAAPVRIAWRFKIVDRCTGAVTDAPGTFLTVLPQWPYAFGTSTVSLPPGRALALVAVTASPAEAASPPLLIPAAGASC